MCKKKIKWCPWVGMEPGRSTFENLSDDSQRLNHLSYCCLYDTDVLLRLVYLGESYVCELAASLGLSSHFYADDSQLYTWGHPSSDGLQRRRMELGVEQ